MAYPNYSTDHILSSLNGYNTQGTGTVAGGSSAGTYNSSSPTSSVTVPLPDPIQTAATNTPLPEMAGGGNYGGGGGNHVDPKTGASGFGWNMGTLDLVLGGIKTIGNLWASWQQNKLAKEQLKMQTDLANINVANQIDAYNTALEDKTRHRASFNELSQGESDAYLASHKLEDRQIG